MSNPTPPQTRTQILDLARQGLSLARIAAQTGVSRETVRRIRSEPFGVAPPGGQPPANVPVPAYGTDQTPPPPRPLVYDRAYHGHTFRSYSAPLAFDGWDVDRIRNAISLHDQGMFIESSSLAVVSSRFGPVFAALSQAIAPGLALPRHVNGGTRGLARILKDEVEAQIAPRAGLLPSACFPPTVWGSVQIDLAQMGFAVLQHVYGDPDPDTGVMPIYTRRWPTWAVQYYRYRRTYVALTSDGPVDIVSGDGKFTLIGDTEEPHFEGAIRAAGLEVLDGSLVKQARASYVDRYGNPKWVGIMPEGVSTWSKEGSDFFEAMKVIQGPNGWGVLPHGSEYHLEAMASSQSAVFKDSLDSVWAYVAAIYLGSDGTLSKGVGVYTAPIFAGVRRDIVDRRLKAMVRGVNQGHVAPWLEFNYAQSIRTNAGWVEPVLDIPLPDPDADARIKSYSDRLLMLHAIVKAERDAGFVVTEERMQQLCEKLDLDVPTLGSVDVTPLDLAPTDVAKVIRVKEARASRKLGPLGDERDDLMISELDRPQPLPEAQGGVAPAAAPLDAKPAGAAEMAQGPTPGEQPAEGPALQPSEDTQ